MYRANNLFATTNSQEVFYKLLPKNQYELDKSIGATARMDANTESETPIIPMVQVIAYGNNCRLEDGAIKATSKADLLSKNSTAFYSNGEEFWVRIIPEEKWGPISDDPVVQATALASNKRFGIKCDDGYLPKRVKGAIEKVERTNTTTTISGWACNYTHSSAIHVKVYAGGTAIRPYSQNRGPGGSFPYTHLTEITQGYSNKTPDPEVSFKCGYPTGYGRRFSIIMNNSSLANFTNHKFYVKGLSNSGGADLMILNSGKYRVLPRKITTSAPLRRSSRSSRK